MTTPSRELVTLTDEELDQVAAGCTTNVATNSATSSNEVLVVFGTPLTTNVVTSSATSSNVVSVVGECSSQAAPEYSPG